MKLIKKKKRQGSSMPGKLKTEADGIKKGTRKMKTNKENQVPAELKFIVPFVGWMEKYPKLANIILVLELIALALAAFFYDFTTTL